MEHSVFLTFDDGPHPQVTPYILDLLKQYDCQATFFCLGENIEKYPEYVARFNTIASMVEVELKQYIEG